MKFYIYFLFFLLMGVTGHTQYTFEDLSGGWICELVTHPDGSQIIDPDFEFHYAYLDVENDDKGIFKYAGKAFNEFISQRNIIIKDTLFCDGLKFKIESLKNDSLVLIECSNNGIPLQFSNLKLHFVWKPFKDQVFITENNKNDTVTIPYYYAPFLYNSVYVDFQKEVANLSKILTTTVVFTYNAEENKMYVSFGNKNTPKRLMRKYEKIANENIDKFLIPFRDKFKKINIEYKITREVRHLDEYTLMYYNGFGLNIDKKNSITKRNISKAKTLFLEAVEHYNSGNKNKALATFIQSYNNDEFNVETMMNIAAIYFELGEKEKACIWWKKLKDLRQVEGTKRYDYYCQ